MKTTLSKKPTHAEKVKLNAYNKQHCTNDKHFDEDFCIFSFNWHRGYQACAKEVLAQCKKINALANKLEKQDGREFKNAAFICKEIAVEITRKFLLRNK